jgi:hypothetical protein
VSVFRLEARGKAALRHPLFGALGQFPHEIGYCITSMAGKPANFRPGAAVDFEFGARLLAPSTPSVHGSEPHLSALVKVTDIAPEALIRLYHN